DAGGRVRAVDVEPADARVTGAHLSEVARSHGAAGLAQTLRGLAVTRGRGFAAAALGQAPPAVARLGADPGAPDLDEVALGGDTARAVAGSAGAPLPAPIAGRLAAASGHSFAGVRVHHDRLAGESAERLGARAFTVGQDIYFAGGAYRPETTDGYRLLAHEAAHTVQQRGATVPPLASLEVGSPHDAQELE